MAPPSRSRIGRRDGRTGGTVGGGTTPPPPPPVDNARPGLESVDGFGVPDVVVRRTPWWRREVACRTTRGPYRPTVAGPKTSVQGGHILTQTAHDVAPLATSIERLSAH